MNDSPLRWHDCPTPKSNSISDSEALLQEYETAYANAQVIAAVQIWDSMRSSRPTSATTEVNTSAVVKPLLQGQVSRLVAVSLTEADAIIVAAIEALKLAEVPQGLIIALLHIHTHTQTTEAVKNT